MAQKLILFDFDGTLTTKDTMIEFIRFVRGGGKSLWSYAWLFPTLFGMKMGWVANDRAKVRLLKHHFAGMSRQDLEGFAKRFCKEVVPGLLRPEGIRVLEAYRADGDRVILVSASLELWLKPWAEDRDIELLSTKGAWEGDRFTGELDGPNCNGEEKVRRVRAHVREEIYSEVIAYGDSSGDKAMLAMADQGHFKPFRDPTTSENK